MHRRLKDILFTLILLLPTHLFAKPLAVFLNPGFATESFWSDVDGYINEASRQLDVELEILHANRDRIMSIELLQKRLEQKPTPDYFILVNEKGIGLSLLNTLQNHDVYVTFVLNDLSDEEIESVNSSKFWQERLLPGVIPSNADIGYLTAQEMFNKGGQHPGEMIVISGDKNTPASVERESGALRFINEQNKVTLAQRVYANWNEKTAYRQMKVLLNRYPKVRYIWTANDHMAFGVGKAINETNKIIGSDIHISSVNTSKKVLELVNSRQITTLGGGHFSAPGLVLSKISQHEKGKPWIERKQFTLFELIQPQSSLLNTLYDKQWQNIDFEAINLNSTPVNAFIIKDE